MEQWSCSMENLEVTQAFWQGRKVFITGHTGFKGGWLALLLSQLGSEVHGYSLDPPTTPNFFKSVKLEELIHNSTIADIRDLPKLIEAMQMAKPSIIFHMAAKSLVRQSYREPAETYTTNINGTINVFEAAKKIDSVEVIINVTSDKCYENQERDVPYRENDKLGGYDPYSSSKACSEIITSAYRNLFFKENQIKLASARAGNVIGGGDWAMDRLIPDFFRSIYKNEILRIRSPKAVRPWQHVLDPLSGYLLLAKKLQSKGNDFADAWNFGPELSNCVSVSNVLEKLSKKFDNVRIKFDKIKTPHEATLLKLDISKSKSKLGWVPRWPLDTAIDYTVNWYQAFKNDELMSEFSIKQIKNYLK